jgi:hypothetical protein
VSKVEAFMDALLNSFDKVGDYISDDFVWINYLPDHIPFGGEYHGLAGLTDYMQRIAAALELGPIEFEQFYVAEDDTVIVTGMERDTSVKATGKRYSMPFVWVFRFDAAGKLAYLREHNDTLPISVAFEG